MRETPLMAAVLSKRSEVMQTLLNAGADVNVKAIDGKTALDLAEREKLAEIINLLKQAGAKRGNELPDLPKKDEPSTSWQIQDDAELEAAVDPWPPSEGNANLKIDISKDDYNRSFSGTLEYRIARTEENSEPWLRLPQGEQNEDGDVLLSIQIKLARGPNIIQFRLRRNDDKDSSYLDGWNIEVK